MVESVQGYDPTIEERVDTRPMTENDAPIRRKCGAMQAHFALCERHPEFRENLAELERQTTRRMMFAEAARRTAEPITLPVVVHIVHDDPSMNISDEQVESQISTLNRDFRARNEDKEKVPDVWRGLVADCGIEFALATENPDGQPTTGITRTETDVTEFAPEDEGVKSAATGGADPWPTDRYLNIWVCRLRDGLLGYAQFPGGPPATDGVVILSTALGTMGTALEPFNLGRTATHEVGHWLNLRHIWGDREDCFGTDFVEDTPNANHPNFGLPRFPHISCNNAPNGDMFVNYMDYVDDAAMFMFTPQQVARMQAALDGPRSGIGSAAPTGVGR